VVKAIKKRPMGLWEICTDTGIRIGSVKRALAHLEGLYIIEKRKITNYATGKTKELWFPLTRAEQRKKWKQREEIE